MKTSDAGRYALALGVAVAFLAGCGGSSAQFPVPAGPSPVRQQPNNASDRDLLYVSNGPGYVTVYRYWQRSFVRQLTGFKAPKGECVDHLGDVFVTDSGTGKIREYAHDGKKPSNVLDDHGYEPYGCSVDPRTGNLAVANHGTKQGGAGGIAIYVHASGNPRVYGPIKYLYSPISVGYDDRGNLLIASRVDESSSYEYATFALLPRGSQTFVNLDLGYITSSSPFEYVTSVQWDGQYWAIADSGSIVRYSIERSGKSTFKGSLRLSGLDYEQGQFWITNFPAGSQIVGTAPNSSEALYWEYPAGGSTIGSVSDFLNRPYGITVSRRNNEGANP